MQAAVHRGFMLFGLHDAKKPKIYINFAVLQSI